MSIVNKSGNAFGADGAFQIGTGLTMNGCNSIAIIDGVTVERTENCYTIDGVEYDLTQATGRNEEYLEFTVSRDYTSTVQAVTTFVDAFNTLVKKLSELTTAKDYSSDYPPLTEAQKKEMTDEQIEAWNEKAKNGILRHDSDLERLVASLKNAFFSPAGGTGKSAASIGISTGSYYGSDKGLLVLDTEALSEALKKNPEEVISIFTGGNSSSAGSQQGLVYKMRNLMTEYQKTASNSITSTERKIDGIDTEIGGIGGAAGGPRRKVL